MADNDSVGKISLDLEVTSDLGKQIEHVANNIGKQLEAALSNIGNIDIGKNITNSIEKNMEAMQKIIEKRLSQAIEKAMANMKAMKIPVEFDIPKNITMPKQKIGTDVPAPRGPPQTSIPSINIPSPKMPKIDMGNPEVLKSVIDNMAQSLSIVNAKIEQQQVKLADLKTSYNQAFDGARKNKLLEQILNTEVNINKLISQSDRLGFTLADLDKQFNILGSSAKNAGTGVSEVDKKLKNVNNSASKASSGVKRVSNSTKDMHNNMNRAYGGVGMFIKSMFTWGLIFPMVIGGITSVGKFLGSTLMVNAQFANSLNQIRSNLWVAFMPIYEAILPALNSLMSALATATAYLASFISQLFGTTYNASFQSAKAMQTQIGAMTIADKQAQKAANSLGGVGKSAKKSADQTKKAAEEVTGALAGFDQINKLNLGNNKVDTPDTPKETTPAGSGVVTPITPMANMAPIEAATSGWADKFKNIMANLWKPFQQAWAAEGQNTINAAKHALDGILALLGAIGRSFYIVWTNGTGERILVNLLKILQDILNIIGDIGFTFANAWNKGDIGTQIIQSLANSLNNVLSLIDKMLQSVRRVWGKEGPKFADMFMQALKAGSDVIENLTQKLGWVWDHGGQHAFEGLVKLGLKVGELALFIFTNFVAPFVNWFVNMIAPAIAPVLDVLGKVFDKVSNLIDWLMSDGKPVLDVILKVVGSIFLAFKTWEGINTIVTGVKGTIDNVRSTIDNVQKSVEIAGKGFSTFKGFVSDAASAMADYGKKVGDVILKMADVTANLAKQILKWIAQTAKIVASTIATAAATAAQIAHNIAVGAWTIICGLATIATTAFGTAIAFLTSPIGLAVLAIAAVIAIGILLYKNWDTIKAKAIEVWNSVTAKFNEFKNWLGSVFSTDWSQRFGMMGNILNGLLANVKNIFGGVKRIFSGVIDFIAGVFTGDWKRAWKGVVNVFGGIFDTIKSIAKAPLNGLISLVNTAIDKLNQFHAKVPEGVPIIGGKEFGLNIPKIPYLAKGGIVDKATTAVIGEAGPEAVVPLKNNTGGLDILANLLSQKISDAIHLPEVSISGTGDQNKNTNSNSRGNNYGKDLMQSLADNIENTSPVVIKVINDMCIKINDIMDTLVKSFTEKGKNADKNIGVAILNNNNLVINPLTKVVSMMTNILSDFINTGKSIWNGFSSFLSNLWGNIKSTASNSWNAFKNTISNLVSNTVDNAKNTWNGLVDWFRNLPGTFRNLGRDMINALGDGIKNTVNSVVNIAKDLGDKILSKIKEIFGIHSPSREMFKVGNYFVQGFTNALKGNDIGSMVKSVFGDITGLAKGALGGPLGVILKPMIDSGAFGKIGGLLKGVADKGASFLSSMFGGSGGVSGNVSSWLQAAMAITGTPMQYLPMLSSIAQHESGGDPRSINLWDSNAMAGTPSKGLMQMIDETFNRWAMPGMNNIWNPIDNAVSSIRYMIGRYGSIANVPGIRNMAGGGSYVGYAKGTNSAKKGLAMTGEVGPEMIDFSGGEMVLNLKDTISLISSAVNTIGNIKNAIAGISTIQQPQLSMTGTSSSDTSNDINRLIAEIKELIEAIKSIKGDSHGGNNQPIPDINLDLLIRIGDTPFGKAVIKAINKLQKQAGKTLIDI